MQRFSQAAFDPQVRVFQKEPEIDQMAHPRIASCKIFQHLGCFTLLVVCPKFLGAKAPFKARCPAGIWRLRKSNEYRTFKSTPR